MPGDHLPGIPAHLVKLGFQYKVTDAWTIGAAGVGASGRYLFGDEANLTPKLPGYFVLNLNTSYQITHTIHAHNGLQVDEHEFNISPQGTALVSAFHKQRYDLSKLGGPRRGWL